ncbi:VOC family protein [Streptomyces roseicoloratus]|uniref:VOC family protein n=1 Tax=Streptomyces roseicoloratus TaxID=2508722 RepID=A0ABY9RZ52_9ACTN|nr:VOC family protein [Streptomyces roseicoloratus]WMX46963.1 VOC family protein [Streptomyces roseicoloratus]
MTLILSHTTVDARDPYALAQWWCELAEFTPHEGVSPGSDECYVITGTGHTVLFNLVPDEKTVKNRVHFCLRPDGRSQDEEVDRAIALGASVVTDFRGSYGWVVMADPEGNEFCVLSRK